MAGRLFTVAVVLLFAVPALCFGPMGGFGAGGNGPGAGPDVWSGLDYKPVVGQWSEYKMVASGDSPVTMRISIVGEEDGAFWYETVLTPDEGERVISKMLVLGDPDDPSGIKRMIVKSGDEPAMEMPMQMMKMMEGMGMEKPEPVGEPEADEGVQADMAEVGVESITVPAGTFEATHIHTASGEDSFDAWVSPKVGPYGVVKSKGGDFEMTLMGYGDKATTLITEEPQSLPMGGFPMGGMHGE